MTNFKKQAFAAITTIAVLANVTGSAFAATTTIEVTGNGRNSSNAADVTNNSSSTNVQTNVATVDNNIKVNADTGGNRANDNSGEVRVGSGNATSDVTVINDLNKNLMRGNCCETGNTNVKIGDNARNSDNTVNLDQNSSKDMFQTNVADVNNNVDVRARTGDNRANDNSGDSVEIESGNADTTVTLLNEGNVNWAVLGGTGAGGANGNVSAMVVGNARDSVNEIDLSLTKNTDLLQTNSASVMNDVDVDADTGGNRANDNSGEVMIDSGNAMTEVGIYNSLNFNMAALDCGCLLGNVNAKIGDNARDSDNRIRASLDDSKEVFQTNAADLNNVAEVDAMTGDNEANDTWGSSDDPAIDSGNSDSAFEVVNSGNENRYGTSMTMPGGSQVQLTWSWASMMAFFGM